jgi:hypothetical protein
LEILMLDSVLTQHRNKKGINGRFSRSEKVKKFWKTWDTAVNISDKKLNSNSREYYHRNSLVDKIKLTEKEAQDYKLKIIGDAKTIKMYEEYFKTHSYK